MSWDTLADIALKKMIDTFKTTVVYTSIDPSVSPTTFQGVFNIDTQMLDPNTGALIDSYQPSIGLRLADLPCELQFGDTFLIKGVTYRLTEIDADAEGGAKVNLNKIG